MKKDREIDICRGIYKLIVGNLKRILLLRSTWHLKDDNTFVSEGDLLCEKIIFDYINDNLSDYTIISEESENIVNNLMKYEYVITIDPIDGSENFVSGLKEWGIGVSIYKNMKHYQSMIAMPELDICLTTGDLIDKIPYSRICGLSSYMSQDDFKLLGKEYEYRIMGCCMYNMYNVIKGSYNCFKHLKGCYSWDILPGLNIALEHKLSVMIEGAKYNGEFLMPGIKYRFEISNPIH